MPVLLPLFSNSALTADAHHNWCCHRRDHCDYRCLRREDDEIDDLLYFQPPFPFLFPVHLHVVCCIYALFNLRPSTRNTRHDV